MACLARAPHASVNMRRAASSASALLPPLLLRLPLALQALASRATAVDVIKRNRGCRRRLFLVETRVAERADDAAARPARLLQVKRLRIKA